ncbi:MAG: hypothetical protein CO030_03685 [Candidatus Magasanikbacteria bacterium CG_4_9_14_0_2_um_filter_42_11]|uniref:Cardiolipin synthase N-terminal domain-containing protein n=1 Tax=Candidatus Magasanikbacteria bacterium CG_4_9_14_0_2_um_filter_42_11 TaxID=1974643 RepID=A0A2M8F968_9BACT|nr:MAG: hypothetical protein COU34_04410 [Candidatus Magasanikbacteria bacterium CG10_big_fil_rev_8_21_14_0_10_43_9]PIY92557.1 MAG: hypothetical protein COY70_02595 [Candidatus Magasanikbacteria bacterium CG_4_10_14_0_8_um_filter_42_12]PJC52277.1 MAG: hypothetical protein CO030_03685 [Candidatus Magasanikbacteria bacterium CG_4_9_14_0_2_um_filter_42_11]
MNELSANAALIPPDTSTSIFSIIILLLSFLGLIAVLSMFVFWLVAFIQVLTRNNLKESKWLWILLLLFVGPIGILAYFFVENRKKWGIASVIFLGLLPFVLVVYAIANMVLVTRI